MKPTHKEYEKPVIVPKVWEEIIHKGKMTKVLITKPVSDYIRNLEKQLLKQKK